MNGESGHTMARDPMPETFGAEELIAMYVSLCAELGLHSDQMKLAALEMIDDALAETAGTLH